MKYAIKFILFTGFLSSSPVSHADTFWCEKVQIATRRTYISESAVSLKDAEEKIDDIIAKTAPPDIRLGPTKCQHAVGSGILCNLTYELNGGLVSYQADEPGIEGAIRRTKRYCMWTTIGEIQKSMCDRPVRVECAAHASSQKLN